MYEVVCVWVGDKYSEEYVINLYRGVAKNLTLPFRFNVITDKPRIANKVPCRIIPLPTWTVGGVDLLHHRRAWWYKMVQFDPACEFQGPVLYLDLDLVIIDSLDKFFQHRPKGFCICQDFNRQFAPSYHVSNSSVMCYHPKRVKKMWDEFSSDPDRFIRQFRGDQDFITYFFEKKGNAKSKVWWPREWAMSWKWEIEKGGKKNNGNDRSSYHKPDEPFVIPRGCSIVVCHGDPKPEEIHKRMVKYWNKAK